MLQPREAKFYLQCLSHVNLRADQFTGHVGVSTEEIEQLSPISMQKTGALLHTIATRTPADFSSLCDAFPPLHLGVFGYALTSAKTLRERLAIWCRYSLVSGHPLRGSFHDDGNSWTFELRPRFPMSLDAYRLCSDVASLGFIKMCQSSFGIGGDPMSVHLPHSNKHWLRERGYPSVVAFFGSDYLHICGDTNLLDRPANVFDSELKDVCITHCDKLIAEMQTSLPVVDKVRLKLAKAERVGSVSEIAAQLGLSTRSLHRSLAADLTTFGALVDVERRRRASSRLSTGKVPIKAIAWELGLDDVDSFRRLFRFWTGQSITSWIARAGDKVELLCHS